jgi:hypothetical protein
MDTLHAFQLFLLSEMIRDANFGPGESIGLPPEFNFTNQELEMAELQVRSLGFMKLPDESERTVSWYTNSWYRGSWYRKVLGAPIHEQVDEKTGLYSLRFRLPLWPSLDFEIHLQADGGIWNKLGFSRAYDSSSPRLESAQDLMQWGFVKDEIEERFGPGGENDGWDTFEMASYLIPEHPEGAMKKYRLWFSYDLLQKIVQED